MLPLVALIPLIASIVSTTAKGVGSYRENKHQKELEEFAKKEKKAQEREARRSALRAAIGDTSVYAPQPGVEAPTAPDSTATDITAGIADIIGQAAAMGYKAPGSTPGAAGAVKGSGMNPAQYRDWLISQQNSRGYA